MHRELHSPVALGISANVRWRMKPQLWS